MNRFQFLGSQVENGQEFCFILDTQTGETLKSPVKTFTVNPTFKPPTTGAAIPAPMTFTPGPVRDITPTAPVAVTEKKDPAGDIETPEQRKVRLGGNKVPPAFLGDIRRMNMDPSKNANGVTDVTQTH